MIYFYHYLPIILSFQEETENDTGKPHAEKDCFLFRDIFWTIWIFVSFLDDYDTRDC